MAISTEDWRIVKQHVIQAMVEVIVKNDDDSIQARLTGIVNGGSMNIDSGSSIRRTASFSLVPTEELTNINEQSLIWIDKKVEISFGILDQRKRTGTYTHNGFNYKGKYRWWKMGTFLYNNANLTFDASTYTLSIELSDMAMKLDGTTNGQLAGALTHVYAAYDEDPDTGQPLHYNTIKVALQKVLTCAGVTNYHVEDIGEFYGIKRYNPNWQTYRVQHPLWNKIPYDLEFSIGASVWDIISEMTGLYPNYDAAFNENGRFDVGLIPSVYEDENAFFFEDYKDMIISEQSSTDLTTIRNICEVWGEALDANGYAEGTCKGANVSYFLYTETVDNQYKVKGYVNFTQTGQASSWQEDIDLTIHQNLELSQDYYRIRITYDGTILRVIACNDVMYSGQTYHAGEVVASCEYGGVLFPGNPGYLFSAISGSLEPPHSHIGRFVMLVEGYNKYRDGDRFGVKFNDSTVSGIYHYGDFMQINNLEPLGVVDASTGQYIEEDVLDTKHIHVFQLVKIYRPEYDDYNFQWWYVGVAQSHALDVLTDGTVGDWVDYTDPDTGEVTSVRKYSQKYFELFYNCDVVTLTYCPDSPYTVQKIGERVDTKTEGEYNNIRSNTLASERAQYENWKNSRMTDNVTITTKLMPFVVPYMKIDYKKHGTKRRDDYIVQSVSHDFENGTSTIQMYTFYPLYKAQPGENDRMTYKYMSGFLNKDLQGDEDQT